MRLEILFVDRSAVRPSHWGAGHWAVEAHPYGDEQGYPAGTCWVFVPAPCPDHSRQLHPIVDMIYVVDHYRRRGIAERLIAACRERWPDLEFTDAISEGGAGLLAKVKIAPVCTR